MPFEKSVGEGSYVDLWRRSDFDPELWMAPQPHRLPVTGRVGKYLQVRLPDGRQRLVARDSSQVYSFHLERAPRRPPWRSKRVWVGSAIFAGALTLLLLAVLRAPTLQGAALNSPRIPYALRLAQQYWADRGHGSACGGHVEVRIVWLGRKGESAEADQWTGVCAIVYDVNEVNADWPNFCAVTIHEYGHLVGLDHSPNPRSVMHPNILPSGYPAICRNRLDTRDYGPVIAYWPAERCVITQEPGTLLWLDGTQYFCATASIHHVRQIPPSEIHPGRCGILAASDRLDNPAYVPLVRNPGGCSVIHLWMVGHLRKGLPQLPAPSPDWASLGPSNG